MEKLKKADLSENEDDPDVYESSSDEWSEEKSPKKRGNRRTSQRLSKKPRVAVVDFSSDDEESKKKKANNGVAKKPAKAEEDDEEEDEVDEEDEEQGEEEDDDDDSNDSPSSKNRKPVTVGGKIGGTAGSDYVNGGFLILKKDAQSGDSTKNPCLWRIDGKALLQKYEAFEEEGLVKHRNTSIYTGWSSLDKDLYHPVTVKVLQHQGQNMTVELNWEKLKEIKDEDE